MKFLSFDYFLVELYSDDDHLSRKSCYYLLLPQHYIIIMVYNVSLWSHNTLAIFSQFYHCLVLKIKKERKMNSS